MIISILLALLSFFSSPGFTKGPESGEALILQSISAMGGEERLRSISSLSVQGIGHSYFLEQSERPEGPWFVNYEQFSQLRDYKRNRVYVEKETKNILQPGWQKTSLVFADSTLAVKSSGDLVPGRRALEGEMREILDYAPEQLLLAALEAEELQTLSDTVIQGVNHHSIGYNYKGTRVNLFLNSNTSLPSLIRSFRKYPQDIMWSVWGEVRNDLYLSAWTLSSDKLLYPLQYNLYRNGQPFREFTIVDLKVNEAINESLFEIPEDLKERYAAQPVFPIKDLPLGRPGEEPKELAPGIFLISGFWNITLVAQEDGVVMLEAPISEEYTSRAMEKAESLFPSKKLKGVVSSSDAWPHIGGMAAVVKHRLPVFTHHLNEPILRRLLASSQSGGTEASPARLSLNPVKEKMKIGAGDNRMELYPVGGESSERMTMVYFPEHKLLYASDLIQKNSDGSFFQKAYLAELVAAIEKNRLEVKQVFAMHTGLIPISEIIEVLK